jgi:hypothetical protein
MSAHQPIQVTADLCSVGRDVDGVLILFGERVHFSALEGALSAHSLHRISMSEGGASKLQDLLMDLLRAQDAP